MKSIIATITFSFLWSSQVFAGAWSLQQGRLYIKLGVSYIQSSHQYDFAGEKVAFDLDGQATNTSVFVDSYYGLNRKWTARAFVSYSDYRFEDLSGSQSGSGIGDLFFGLQYQIRKQPFALSAKGELKLPTGDWSVSYDRVPLGEGQTDIAFSMDAGKSLYPVDGYIDLEVGYKYRAENPDILIKPGNQFFLAFEAGYSPYDRLFTKLRFELIESAREESFGFQLAESQRRLWSLSPEAYFTLAHGVSVFGSAKVPVRGKNHLAGTFLAAGIVYDNNIKELLR